MSETEKQSSSINLSAVTVETGAPPLASRAATGGFARGSKYDAVLDAAPKLQPGSGFIRVTLENGEDKERAIGAIRVALKRRFKDDAKAYKVRKLEGDKDLGVFRV